MITHFKTSRLPKQMFSFIHYLENVLFSLLFMASFVVGDVDGLKCKSEVKHSNIPR